MNNKHPHHDLIVELSGDMSKKIQFYSKPISKWCDSSIVDLSSDTSGRFNFRIKPRDFISNGNRKVRCSKTIRCKWEGLYCEMTSKKIKYHELEIIEKACPRCGSNEFHEVDL